MRLFAICSLLISVCKGVGLRQEVLSKLGLLLGDYRYNSFGLTEPIEGFFKGEIEAIQRDVKSDSNIFRIITLSVLLDKVWENPDNAEILYLAGFYYGVKSEFRDFVSNWDVVLKQHRAFLDKLYRLENHLCIDPDVESTANIICHLHEAIVPILFKAFLDESWRPAENAVTELVEYLSDKVDSHWILFSVDRAIFDSSSDVKTIVRSVTDSIADIESTGGLLDFTIHIWHQHSQIRK